MKKLLLLLINFSFASTLYVGSAETYATVDAAGTAMSAGDTIIIRNGTLTGASNDLSNIKSGNSDADRSYVLAETDWAVTLDMNGSESENGTVAAPMDDKDFIYVQGINFTDTDYTVCSGNSGTSYITFKFCSFSETSNGNHYGVGFNDTQYCLFEDCFVFGRFRYGFGVSGNKDYSSQYIIFRRCVVRMDYFWSDPAGEEPHGGFIAYQEADVWFQNCILIDALEARNYTTGSYSHGFFGPNGTQNNTWYGCIQVNCQVSNFWESPNSSGNLWDHCLIVGTDGNPFNNGMMGANATSLGGTIRNTSFFYSNYNAGIDAANQGGIAIDKCVFYGDTISGGSWLFEDILMDSTVFSTSWGSHANTMNAYSATNATNTFNTAAYNPSLSYTYSLSPDVGSQLETSGLGASIKYRMGTDGTYWGQAGWNTLTSDPLFPFAFEDSMKAIMGRGTPIAAGNYEPQRGWVISGKSLGEYIAEYDAFADDWSGVTLDSTVSHINDKSYAYPQDFVLNGTGKAISTFATGFKLWSMTNDTTVSELDKYWTEEHCFGAAIQNDTAYVVTDSFTYMIDISGTTISILDSVQLLGGQDVKVSGQSLWILTSTNFYLRDATDLTSTTSTAIGGYSLTLGGADTILVARTTTGLDFRDASDLTLFRNLPVIRAGSQVRKAIPVGKDFVYTDGLRLYKYNFVADAKTDSLVDTNVFKWVTSNAAQDTVYPVLVTDGQLVVDVATLSSVGEVVTDYYEYYRGMYNNGFNYIGAFSQVTMGTHIYNVMKQTPTLAGYAEANDYVRGVFAIGSYVYGAEGHYGASLYTNTYNDFIFQARTRHNSFWNVKANTFWSVGGDVDGTIYLMTPTLTDLDNDSFAGYDHVFVGDSTFISVSQTEGIARYTINDNALTQSHISTAISAPRQIWANSTLDTVWFADGIKVYAALASDLTLVDSVTSNCLYMTGNDNHLFGSKSATGDEIIKFTHTLNFVDSVASTESRAMFADNNYLYVAREENGMSIYNPDDLTILVTVPTAEDVINVFALNGLVYIAESGALRWINHHGTTPGAYTNPLTIYNIFDILKVTN